MIFYCRLLCLLVLFTGIGWFIRRTVRRPESFEQLLFIDGHSSHPNYEHNAKYAYVCLCANVRAVYPTLVLFQQLHRVQATRGVYVALISTEVPEALQQIMRLFNITTITYAPRPLFKLGYDPHSKSTWERDRILWQKIRVWAITDFEKIVMLDYDLLIQKNFDELFDQEELAGVPMLHADEKVAFWQEPQPGDELSSVWRNLTKIVEPKVGWTGLNSGVLVLRPSKQTYMELVDAASKLQERTCCPSQELIFRYFEVRSRYTRLPPIYNLRKLHLFPPEERHHYQQEVKIYHFVEKRKPIVMGRKQAAGDPFSALWWEHATAVDHRLVELNVSEELVRAIRIEAIRSALH